MIDEIFGWGWLAIGLPATAYGICRAWQGSRWLKVGWVGGAAIYWGVYLSSWIARGDFGVAFLSALLFGSAFPFVVFRIWGGHYRMISDMAGRAVEAERQRLLPFVKKYRWKR